MLRYQTRIVVPPDRYVCLQLPEDYPLGQATITVHFPELVQGGPAEPTRESDRDHEDIEWWEEFGGPSGEAG